MIHIKFVKIVFIGNVKFNNHLNDYNLTRDPITIELANMKSGVTDQRSLQMPRECLHGYYVLSLGVMLKLYAAHHAGCHARLVKSTNTSKTHRFPNDNLVRHSKFVGKSYSIHFYVNNKSRIGIFI